MNEPYPFRLFICSFALSYEHINTIYNTGNLIYQLMQKGTERNYATSIKKGRRSISRLIMECECINAQNRIKSHTKKQKQVDATFNRKERE